MSEKQAKRLRALESRETALADLVADHNARLTACEASVSWMLADEEAGYGRALEQAGRHLRRAEVNARNWEATARNWKTIAITAIAVLAAVVFGIMIL